MSAREAERKGLDPKLVLEKMRMPEMGYAVIDKQGRIHTEEVDRQFGEHVNDILRGLRSAKSAT
jgi:hypothetical protein